MFIVVISGGQTGADKTALVIAKSLNIQTGGTAPAGYRTERGADLTLKDFGLVESPSRAYPPRTRENVRNACGTVWYGAINTAGYKCTMAAIERYNKPYIINPKPDEFVVWFRKHDIKIVNIAGNSESRHPDIEPYVKRNLTPALLAIMTRDTIETL